MNYEKKYKEALKVMESLYNVVKYQLSTDALLTSQTIEKAFPELRESKDDKIRKELISFVRNDGWKFIKLTKEEKESWIAWLEKQGERTHDNKVEPKFKVGDFILNGDITDKGEYEIFKILKVCSHWYDVENIYDGRQTMITFTQEYTCRLWTIKDAKDGDVLACSGVTFIFNKIHSFWLNCHCSRSNDGMFIPESYDLMIDTYFCEVHPATKKQHDLLFQKMKKAEYEWDAEKKELKKIEHTSADETPYPETLEKAIDLYYYSYGNGKEEFEHLSLEKFRDIVHTFVNDYGQKSTWSKEDEEKLNSIIEVLGEDSLLVNWLKSLKPQQNLYDKGYNDGYSAAKFNHWKPSEKQIKSLRIALQTMPYSKDKENVLVILEELLKI